jgi:hypothetical protein
MGNSPAKGRLGAKSNLKEIFHDRKRAGANTKQHHDSIPLLEDLD